MKSVRRIIALLLIAALTLSCLACGKSDKKDKANGQELSISADWEIAEEFKTAINEAVIMRVDSAKSVVKGVTTEMLGNVPAFILDKLYIPVEFVAESMGGTAEHDETNKVTAVTLNEQHIEIPDNGEHFVVDGENVAVEKGCVTVNESSLVQAEEFCEIIGKELVIEDELILIGDNLSQGEEAILSEEKELIYSVLQGELSGDDTDGDSEVYIETSMVPWESEAGELVSVVGSMYIEDVKVTESKENQDAVTCSMTIYNYMNSVFGAVEVYNAQNELIGCERVYPFMGEANVIFVSSDEIMANDSYRDSQKSKMTEITVEVPKDGHIRITNNMLESEHVAVFNTVNMVVELAFASDNAPNISQELSGSFDIFKEKLKDKMIDYALSEATRLNPFTAKAHEVYEKLTKPLNVFETTETIIECSYALAESMKEANLSLTTMADAVLKTFAEDDGENMKETADEYKTVTETMYGKWSFSKAWTNIVRLFKNLDQACDTGVVVMKKGDWREAYADILRDNYIATGDMDYANFSLGYINGDSIPELIVIHSVGQNISYGEIYSYQKGEVIAIMDSDGDASIAMPNGGQLSYVPYKNQIKRANLNHGMLWNQYLSIVDNILKPVHELDDNSYSGESEVYYKYNKKEVSKWYYEYKMGALERQYDSKMITIDGSVNGKEISESNISSVFGE